jgi:hypothetical protein
MFSVLAKLFKESELRCIDDLIRTIEAAPISPSPVCKNLFYTFDWKGYIQQKLAKTPLEYHSFYHSFKFSKEEGKSKFRAKLYPQDLEYGPSNGIQLIRDGVQFSPVGPTEFRVQNLELDRVFKSLQGYFSTFPLQERIRVSSSWDALRKTLESLPSRKDQLLKMNIAELPKQPTELRPVLPEHFAQFVTESEVPELRGEVYPEKVAEGDFNAEIVVGADVVIYTKSKSNRPWVGRVVRILPGQMFTVHWYQRRSRGNTFYALVKSDGSPVQSEQSNEVVMFWHISEAGSRTEDSFQLSYYWLEKIRQEYLEHDAAYV